tara:strand:- start:1651 stop:2721 length:1071 start_codon:yes stop_codon:yes gene_type:complete
MNQMTNKEKKLSYNEIIEKIFLVNDLEEFNLFIKTHVATEDFNKLYSDEDFFKDFILEVPVFASLFKFELFSEEEIVSLIIKNSKEENLKRKCSPFISRLRKRDFQDDWLQKAFQFNNVKTVIKNYYFKNELYLENFVYFRYISDIFSEKDIELLISARKSNHNDFLNYHFMQTFFDLYEKNKLNDKMILELITNEDNKKTFQFDYNCLNDKDKVKFAKDILIFNKNHFKRVPKDSRHLFSYLIDFYDNPTMCKHLTEEKDEFFWKEMLLLDENNIRYIPENIIQDKSKIDDDFLYYFIEKNQTYQNSNTRYVKSKILKYLTKKAINRFDDNFIQFLKEKNYIELKINPKLVEILN